MSGTIDVSSTVPTREFLYDGILHMPEIYRGYLRIFAPPSLRAAGLSVERIEEMLRSMTQQGLEEFFSQQMEGFPRDLDEFVAALDSAGVRASAVHNFDEQTTTGVEPVPNEKVAEIMGKYAGRFIGFAGVDPHKGTAAVKEIERCINGLGLNAVALRPFMHDIYANDPKYFPLYARCEELGVPVWIHTSVNWTTKRRMDYGRPIYLDDVCIRFPGLKVIAGHGGWPWVNEMVALAWRHEHLYLDISAHRPRYLQRHGSGWDMLLHFGNTTIQDKVLFGSDWLNVGVHISKVIEEVRSLPLKPTVLEKWLRKNAEKVFGL
ncbi:MAG: amidohydrolase [Candidatus Hydrogenedentota bacterium]|nr:MAG: amidohydrolase [Candidatus Hydrogenedentota bacterium]